MRAPAKITDKGRVFYAIGMCVLSAIFVLAGVGAYMLCVDNPNIEHIADKHIDALSNGLMTYASISVGFILTEFALLLSFSSSPFFRSWQKSGKFKLWQSVNVFAIFSSIAVLVSSFILLGWDGALPVVVGILAVNALSLAFVFVPLLVVAGNVLRGDDV